MLKRRIYRNFSVFLVSAMVMITMFSGSGSALTGTSSGVHGHDPSAIRVGDTTYVFSTGFEGGPGGGAITIHKTTDATMYSGWSYVGAVWDSVPSWIPAALGSTPNNFWGPDINYWDNKYWLYYAAAVDSAHIAIGLMTAANIEGPWTDEGQVVGPTEIDPNVVWDGSVPYLMWGGFPSGIYIRRLDPTTGKFSSTYPTATLVATGIENSMILPYGGYYYIMGSKGLCCSGVNSTYTTVLGRASSITGPYYDANGNAMTSAAGTMITYGVKAFTNEIGPGGADWFQSGSDYYFVHHYYDGANSGFETIGIRKILFENGWLTISDGIDSTGSVTPNTPAGYVWAAYEGQSVTLGGTFDVAFGTKGSYSYLTGRTGTIAFNGATFGDPIPGQPKGGYIKTTDLALLHKVSATSSVENYGWLSSKAVDGGRSSVAGAMGWSSNNSLTSNHTESITVDLAESRSVGKVDLYPRNDAGMVGDGFPLDFTIQVSNDNTNWTTVVTKTNYSKPGDAVQSFSFTSQTARYIKVEGTNLRQVAADNNYYRMQLAEIEVYE